MQKAYRIAMRVSMETLDLTGLDDATEHAALALASYFGSGEVSGRIRAFIITAR